MKFNWKNALGAISMLVVLVVAQSVMAGIEKAPDPEKVNWVTFAVEGSQNPNQTVYLFNQDSVREQYGILVAETTKTSRKNMENAGGKGSMITTLAIDCTNGRFVQDSLKYISSTGEVTIQKNPRRTWFQLRPDDFPMALAQKIC